MKMTMSIQELLVLLLVLSTGPRLLLETKRRLSGLAKERGRRKQISGGNRVQLSVRVIEVWVEWRE